jgi:glycolate oxidase FAD binding subunit
MAEYYLDWAGGLIWLQIPDNLSDGGAKIIRGAIGNNGHATLIRGREELRTRIDVFHPPSSAVEKITRRIKEGFDPQNILNPGRMYRIEERQVNN